MAIFKLLDCSSAHAPPADRDRMSEECALMQPTLPVLGVLSYGWLLWVPDRDADFDSQVEQWRKDGWSEATLWLIRYAADQGCQRIQIDMDGDEIDGLPTFDDEGYASSVIVTTTPAEG